MYCINKVKMRRIDGLRKREKLRVVHHFTFTNSPHARKRRLGITEK